MKTIAILAAGLTLLAGPALAQAGGAPAEKGMGHGAMQHGAGMHGDAASKDYMAAMHNMHHAMMKAHDADPDRAFALKMREHHRGALAMAEVLKKHGDNAELKAMAEKSAAQQRKEIEDLDAWLDRNGGRAPKP